MASVQQMANLADDVYNDRKQYEDPDKRKQPLLIGDRQYHVLKIVENKNNGFYGAVYQDKHSGEMIVAYRGTEPKDLQDWKTDVSMVADNVNPQMADAYELTRWAVKKQKEFNEFDKSITVQLSVTGHSLGGTHAQMMAYSFGLKADTFNAYGAVGLSVKMADGRLSQVPKSENNQVSNHLLKGDPVSPHNDHFGKIYLYPNKTYEAVEKVFGANAWWKPNVMKNVLDLYLKYDAHTIKNFVGPNSVLKYQPQQVDLKTTRQSLDKIQDTFREWMDKLPSLRPNHKSSQQHQYWDNQWNVPETIYKYAPMVMQKNMQGIHQELESDRIENWLAFKNRYSPEEELNIITKTASEIVLKQEGKMDRASYYFPEDEIMVISNSAPESSKMILVSANKAANIDAEEHIKIHEQTLLAQEKQNDLQQQANLSIGGRRMS